MLYRVVGGLVTPLTGYGLCMDVSVWDKLSQVFENLDHLLTHTLGHRVILRVSK